jgi:hypothetical protein
MIIVMVVGMIIMGIAISLQTTRSQNLGLDLNLELELEFFKLALGWENIINLPSFSVTSGDERGWAMLNRELQKCHMVKEVFVNNKYLVGVQKEQGEGVAIGEGATLAQATTLALVAAHQASYASREQMREFKLALAKKYLYSQVPAFKQFNI